MSSFTFNGLPIGYGTIMYNGNSSTITNSYPFFTSQSNLGLLPSIDSLNVSSTLSQQYIDDYWLVMPGYKLELYSNADYNSLSATYDNSSGVGPVNYKPTSANGTSSFKLYYKGVLIPYPG